MELPRYQSRDALNITTPNKADKPILANGPPGTRAEMTCLPLHKNLADEPTLVNGPNWVLEHRCLEYHYKKTWQKALLWTMAPLLTTRAEMTCIPLHKTWQINLLWPMDPPPAQVPEQRCLEYQYTKLSRQSYFGQWTLPNTRAEMTCIPLHQMWQMNLCWPIDPPLNRE